MDDIIHLIEFLNNTNKRPKMDLKLELALFPDHAQSFIKQVIMKRVSERDYNMFRDGKDITIGDYTRADIGKYRLPKTYDEFSKYNVFFDDLMINLFHGQRDGGKADWLTVLKLKDATKHVFEALTNARINHKTKHIPPAEVYLELLRSKKYLHLVDFATIFFGYTGSDVAPYFVKNCWDQFVERLALEKQLLGSFRSSNSNRSIATSQTAKLQQSIFVLTVAGHAKPAPPSKMSVAATAYKKTASRTSTKDKKIPGHAYTEEKSMKSSSTRKKAPNQKVLKLPPPSKQSAAPSSNAKKSVRPPRHPEPSVGKKRKAKEEKNEETAPMVPSFGMARSITGKKADRPPRHPEPSVDKKRKAKEEKTEEMAPIVPSFGKKRKMEEKETLETPPEFLALFRQVDASFKGKKDEDETEETALDFAAFSRQGDASSKKNEESKPSGKKMETVESKPPKKDEAQSEKTFTKDFLALFCQVDATSKKNEESKPPSGKMMETVDSKPPSGKKKMEMVESNQAPGMKKMELVESNSAPGITKTETAEFKQAPGKKKTESLGKKRQSVESNPTPGMKKTETVESNPAPGKKKTEAPGKKTEMVESNVAPSKKKTGTVEMKEEEAYQDYDKFRVTEEESTYFGRTFVYHSWRHDGVPTFQIVPTGKGAVLKDCARCRSTLTTEKSGKPESEYFKPCKTHRYLSESFTMEQFESIGSHEPLHWE
jgi:hypothetical protein